MRFGDDFAIDGALASVIKAYILVRQADGGLQWLPKIWPNIKVQMARVMTHFDSGDGTIRIWQQNTYDTAMQGANTYIGSYYVAALRASAAMATLLGESALAAEYQARAV